MEELNQIDRTMTDQPGPEPTSKSNRRASLLEGKAIVASFEKPHSGRAAWQLINSVGGYALAWGLIHWSLSVSWWLAVPLVILAGGFMVRIFIIFHDCGHLSFFKSSLANRVCGFFTGVLTFSPYLLWKQEHDTHHATAGNLDRRGTGDIWTMTVNEFLSSTPRERLFYRLTRHPVVLFFLAPLYVFLLRHRFAAPGSKLKVHLSVWATNLGIALMAWGLASLLGWLPWLVIQLSIVAVGGGAGFWLFYVQHQFEDVYWAHTGNWDYTDAALKGSSYYRLPKVLQWFTGNIGFHHIHHLSHRVPNYHLERCHRSHPGYFSQVATLSLRESFKSLRYRLWDEDSKTLIGFSQLPKRRPPAGAASPEPGGNTLSPAG